ncbi:helix-turn-helix domain-containing protein [Candidatus Xianfuyuplasma coldseepsis]|uniref:Helix-turn-helix transcriptional regulator n=1 Tax=Candidatus Xianfuyuplasma coldseepsis TaxID=2782163 RepID=A0A7L7KTU5_9MOLU|nr:helix-turn-helix transcriptional regulator [Xianfuyuplasma coldseepsis]QMS85732.1 helix-turn-helix transcriptional regulator [Xianfuyuplasma coldseepsis]
MLDLMQIGSKIATYRNQHNMTQHDLAETLYVTHQAVSKWEKGKSMPNIDILYELTKLFHISIDELLNDTEINDNDYDDLFESYPRHIVISKFLQSTTKPEDLDHIFYRLTKPERLRIVQHLIHHPDELTVKDIWHYLNHPERTYLLSVILSGKLDYDLRSIYMQLSDQEQRLVHSKYTEGHYPYKMPNYHIHL